MPRPGVYLSEAQNVATRLCRAGDSQIRELINETEYPRLALCEKRSFLIKFDSGNPTALAVTRINIETLPATWPSSNKSTQSKLTYRCMKTPFLTVTLTHEKKCFFQGQFNHRISSTKMIKTILPMRQPHAPDKPDEKPPPIQFHKQPTTQATNPITP